MADEKRAKNLNVFVAIRDGEVFWQTESKLPKTMVDNMGWSKTGEDAFEIVRPKSKGLAAFSTEIESYGFRLKVLEQQEAPIQTVVGPVALTEGEQKLKDYQDAKDAEEAAKVDREAKREILREWIKVNGSRNSPLYEDSRIAQLGRFRLYNSWTRGNQTSFEKRDTAQVAQWAIGEECGDEVLQVDIVKTVSYTDFVKNGLPEGFTSKFRIDPDMYDFYVRIGAIPVKIQEDFEARGKGRYDVRVFETKDFGCPSCGSKVTKTAKFCGECGTKLGKA